MAQLELGRVVDALLPVDAFKATQVLDALGIAVYATDAAGVITYYNDAAAELWGRRPRVGIDQWCGSWLILRPDGSVMPHDECPLAIALKEDRAVRGDMAIAERPDGSRVWFMPYPTPLHDANGKLVGAVNALVDVTQTMQARQAFTEREVQYRKLMEDLGIAVYTTDAEGWITMYNKAAAALWGRRPRLRIDRWCGAFRLRRRDGTELPHDESPMAVALKEGRPVSGEYVMVERPDGSLIWVEPHPTPLWDSEGSIVGAVNVFLDVTERVNAEMEVRRLNTMLSLQLEEMETVFNVAPIAISIAHDPEAKHVTTNAEGLRMLGVEVGTNVSASGENAGDLAYEVYRDGVRVAPEDLPIQRAAREDVEVKDVELEVRRPDGTVLHLLHYASPLHDASGKVRGAMGIAVDISERKAAEEAVRTSEGRFRALTSLAPVGIFVADARGSYRMVNERWREYAGLTVEQAQGDGWKNALHPDDRSRVVAEWEDAIASRSELTSEFRFQHPNGNVRWMRCSARPLPSGDGTARGYVGTVTDVSELKESEQLKEQFLGLISHELRTPLSTIYGTSRLLEERLPSISEADRTALISGVVSESARLQRIIENLLLMTRLDAGPPRFGPVDFAATLEESLSAFRRRHPEREVDVSRPDMLPRVHGDATYIQLVLDNLLANAAKYSEPGTRIEVHVRADRETVETRVLDRGIGISGQDKDMLFSPFYRSPAARVWTPGVGVGLAVSKRIAEAQGGAIWAKERDGGGAEFGFTLKAVLDPDTST